MAMKSVGCAIDSGELPCRRSYGGQQDDIGQRPHVQELHDVAAWGWDSRRAKFGRWL